MNEKVDCIIKSGIVESIENKYVKVRIHNHSACSMCYSKGVCTSLGSGERVIEVEKPMNKVLIPGESVDIQMITKSGFMAILYGYLLPFALLITTLLLVNSYAGEVAAALASLLILVPYFFALYFLRGKMKRYFRFTFVE